METTYPSWGKDLESSFEIIIGLGVKEHQQFQSLALHDVNQVQCLIHHIIFQHISFKGRQF